MKVVLGVEAIRPPLTGIGRYALELARHLPDVDGVSEVRYFAGRRMVVNPETALTVPLVSPVARRRLLQSRAVVSAYRLLAPTYRRFVLRGTEGFLYHGPNYYLPAFRARSVATFHDLSIYKCPECHPVERVRYMQKELPAALSRAQMLITDSAYTRTEMLEYFGLDPARVVAVPLAASAEFAPMESLATRRALNSLGLVHGCYSLYVGTIEPRKNLDVLLDAYSAIDLSLRRRFPLVLAGFRGWHSDALLNRIASARDAGWVRYLDYVDSASMPSLFAGARMFVFPSRYEGFGLPVLEALKSGVPVVCSNSTSLPEVAGDSAALCDIDDVDGFAAAFARALEDDDWRDASIAGGLVHATKFSWQETARKTVEVYRMALR